MTGYVINLEKKTQTNTNFREVLYTGKHSQLVVMSLKAGEDIGMEVHDTVDQFIRVESGTGKVIMNGKESAISDGFAFVIPAGANHNVINAGATEMKLYTIYSPANHPDKTIHIIKADAEAAEALKHAA
ncbi:cupin domain-containing protein [Candidatus Falkowbacteria bacterium CG10_big_fil_rev_8_21_14_0_10_43_10]|uniref:Cupin domain-containing protein n=1 Tax=Candidatus Falkowbacteria bacterium CG10_big_fil_rev_8_21_14_0_10_43_10 TaxID=1974567 RepID=A0A2H0V2R3_9BACT|nr:MAG: cupin domain-containing protein [Candidatus Falkowbacteria bacterium CG10_big_fil_rev_8_21_14_0_10_43_10]